MAGGWSARARMSGPLVGYVEGFEVELARLGYAPGSVASQLRLVAHLDGWLGQQSLDATALTDVVMERFMAPRRAAGVHRHTARALGPLLSYLRGLGVAPPTTVAEVRRPRSCCSSATGATWFSSGGWRRARHAATWGSCARSWRRGRAPAGSVSSSSLRRM